MELNYPTSIYPVAKELRIPYTRLYNAFAEMGLMEPTPVGRARREAVEFATEEDFQATVLSMLNKTVNAGALARVFGSAMTLGELAALAEQLAPLPEPRKRTRTSV